jgi:adenylate cyclase
VPARGVEKIKTIGDPYMCVAGLPTPRDVHAARVADTALDRIAATAALDARRGRTLEPRIGLHTGPVVAGVIGTNKLIYDLWGHTVNVASRMESHGVPGRVQATQAMAEALAATHRLEPRGEIDVKGSGRMPVWLLVGRRAPAPAGDALPARP